MNADTDKSLRVIVLGGGYAGLVAAIRLAQSERPRFEVLLIDRDEAFVDVTRLHTTVNRPLAEIQTAYRTLADRHRFQFRRATPVFDSTVLSVWQQQQAITLADETLPFDYLVIGTGSVGGVFESAGNSELTARRQINLEQIKHTGVAASVQRVLLERDPPNRAISIVGAGPSGIQFLFELDSYLTRQRERCRLNLINADPQVLSGFPRRMGRYVDRQMTNRSGIYHYPDSRYIGQQGDRIELEDRNGQRLTLDSQLTLLCTGNQPTPAALHANAYGQLLIDDTVLPTVYGVGDCCRFAGSGLNTLSAQAAIRKAKQVVGNICRHGLGQPPVEYRYQEQGYVVSLGAANAVGWVLSQDNILTGLGAVAVQQAVETQFDLLLRGYDTYLDLGFGQKASDVSQPVENH